MPPWKTQQTGMSLGQLLVGAFVVIVVAMLGIKMVPAYIHSAQISQIFREIASDPAMREASDKEVEMSYRKRASVNYIEELDVEDIIIERDKGGLHLSAHYEVRIPLVGNVSLVLTFNPSSS